MQSNPMLPTTVDSHTTLQLNQYLIDTDMHNHTSEVCTELHGTVQDFLLLFLPTQHTVFVSYKEKGKLGRKIQLQLQPHTFDQISLQ